MTTPSMLCCAFALVMTSLSAGSRGQPSSPASRPSANAPAARMSHNPIFRGADPDAVVIGDTVWIYPTFSNSREEQFFTFSSKDLVTWQRHGPILRFANVKWINADGQTNHGAWAPTLATKNGRYYFYFAVGDQNVTVSRIGVAVGNSPAGPFTDSGKPMDIVGARNEFEAIDPMVFTDPKDGKTYLYAGGSNGAKLRVFELNDDMVSIAREVQVQNPPNFTEGAFMHLRNGVYYLSYSHGGWQDASYSVHYATAPSPIGPWDYKGAILVSDDRRKGPGHHSFIRNPTDDQWYIVYHRWNNQTGNGPFRGGRSVCIDKIEYDADGLIKPVVMTDTGVPATSFGTAGSGESATHPEH